MVWSSSSIIPAHMCVLREITLFWAREKSAKMSQGLCAKLKIHRLPQTVLLFDSDTLHEMSINA